MFYFQVYQLAKSFNRPEGSLYCFRDDILLEVTVDLHPPHTRRYDLDNRLKVLIDSFMHARIIKDDSQISRLVVEKMAPYPNGKTVVTIKEL
jgi:Holliday junction resolvase RusA-like endonuclease